MPKVSVYRGRNLLSEHWIDADEVILGRGDQADVPLDSAAASRRHCRIVRKQSVFVLEELGATNGMFVNGTYCNVKRLEHGDRIEIADLLVVFERPPDEARREAARRRGEADFSLSQREIEAAVRDAPAVAPTSGKNANAGTQAVAPDELARLKQAMAAKRDAHFEYTNADGRRSRFVLEAERVVIGFGDDCDLDLGKRRWPGGKQAVEVVRLSHGGHSARGLSRWVSVKLNDAALSGEPTLRDKDMLDVGGHKLRYLARTKLAEPNASGASKLGPGGARGR